jgi:DNA modification methylase
MAPRLVELRRVLKRTGSLYLHCDPTMSHYLKILLDATFNPAWFRNEIIWRRTAVKGDARTRFGRNHDILLYYAAGERPAFSPQATEHTEDYRARFRFDDHDGRGSYRDGPLDSPNPRPNLTYEYKDYPPPHNGWRVSREEMERLDADGRLIFPKDPEARIMRKLYLREREGVPMGDVWTDIAPINSQAVERLGYPTQKPAALLERILRASSADGDVVLDPFCGCGTTVDVAQRLGRRWIGIDITFIAVDLINKRLRDRFPGIDNYETFGIPRDLEGAEDLAKRRPFDFEWWAVSLVGAQPHEKHKQRGDRGIDGVALFDTDGRRKEFGRMLVSVKGGEKVMPTAVRDLLGTVETEKAQMGVLILRTKPSRGVIQAVDHAGIYMWPGNYTVFPRIQVVTVADLLKGIRPRTPVLESTHTRAARARASGFLQPVMPEGDG